MSITLLTQERFDLFRQKIEELAGEAGDFRDEIQKLRNSREKAIRLAREQQYQLELTREEYQKAKKEIEKLKTHLKTALLKIKQLEKEKKQPPKLPTPEPAPVASAVDLVQMVQNYDVQRAKKEEEELFR